MPNVGKSTLFNALTKNKVDASNYPFCTIDPNVGVVEVPDERVSKLAEFSHSKKTVPAAVEFVDIAGLVKGAAEGEGLGNKFLSHIREVDAIAEVVRIFDNDRIIHVHKKIDPLNDVEVIETELILADLVTASKRIGTLEKEARGNDAEAIKKLDAVKKTKKGLEEGKMAKDCGLDKKETESIKDLHLLTFKPILYVYNVSDKNVEISEELKKKNYVVLDIKTEEDIMEMSCEDKKELGLESGIDKLIVESYGLLGLINFFTTGEDETRAWTIKNGSTIHSDFQEKFIRAEVINWQNLLDTGSWAAAREKGLLRTEGKEYIVKDGDVIEFKI